MYKASNKEREPIYAVLQGRANAVAVVAGSRDYPNITGRVKFYQTSAGVLVYAEIMGLPLAGGPCGGRIFGFHIHEGGACSGNSNDWFADTLAHYNPGKCEHPYHAGDLPPDRKSVG